MDLEAEGAIFDSCALAKPTALTFSSMVTSAGDDMEAPIDEPVLGASRQVSALRSPVASPPASSVAPPPSRCATPPLSNAGSPPRSCLGSPTVSHAASAPHARPAGVSPPHLPSASPSLSPPSLPASPRQKRKRADEEPPAAQRKSKRSKAAASAAATEPTTPRPSRMTVTRTSRPSFRPTRQKACATKTPDPKESTAVVPMSSPASPLQKRKRAKDDSSLAQHTSKRSKAAASAAVINSTIPGWFSSALGMLQSPEIPLGECWAVLVEVWVEFEKKEGFKEQGLLPAKERPECVSEWIRRGRPPAWMPAITAVSKLETAFHTWWVSLQPKWRVSSKGAIITTDLESGDDWDHLQKPGLNGLLSVLVGLFYWGRTLKRSAKQHEAWATCVDDCIFVLRHLVE